MFNRKRNRKMSTYKCDYDNGEEVFLKNSVICDYCNDRISPNIICIEELDTSNRKCTYKCAILICSSNSCKRPFLKSYLYNEYKDEYSDFPIHPTQNIRLDLPENIRELSPIFIENYKQTLLAKRYNLSELVGMGYRKSIEFLVTDFVLWKRPQDKSKVLKMTLKQIIDTYLQENPNLYTMSLACAFLGNDFSHYERRHLDKDILDLEAFIKVLVSYISYELTVKDAQEFIR